MGFKDTAKAAVVSGAIMGLNATAPDNNRGSIPAVSRGASLTKIQAAENAARMRTQTRDTGMRVSGNSGKR